MFFRNRSWKAPGHSDCGDAVEQLHGPRHEATQGDKASKKTASSLQQPPTAAAYSRSLQQQLTAAYTCYIMSNLKLEKCNEIYQRNKMKEARDFECKQDLDSGKKERITFSAWPRDATSTKHLLLLVRFGKPPVTADEHLNANRGWFGGEARCQGAGTMQFPVTLGSSSNRVSLSSAGSG
eukprot:Skav228878  [mRNA]  locus=scaffold2395:105308:109525:+ [translate_table: standard]